jgi:hypothetical protein
MDPHHLVHWICTQTRIPSNKNPDPDRYQSDKLDPEPDPHQSADDKTKCMKYEPILAIFHGFEPLFGS